MGTAFEMGDEKILEMDGNDDVQPCHRTVYFKMVKMIHFVTYILS